MHRSLALVFAAFLAAPAVAHAGDLPRSLAALSPTEFAGSVQIADDPAKAAVVLSTQEGYSRGRGVKGAHASDIHLRALVDRASGRVRWQVWHDLVTVRGHQGITAIHYSVNGEPRTAQPLETEHGLDDCPPADGLGMCNRFTRVGFELPESAVREVAASYDHGSRRPWRIRFEDASGRDVTSGLAPAEAAGLIKALDAWRRGRENPASR
ncbi:MAG: hypothetical protein JWQ16_985 [Novosphingobium sp.]|nr:hypothetical protein [Novosphingobium sp.]